MLKKIIYNNLTTKKADLFESNNFSIRFSPNWRRVKKIRNKTILDFINLKKDIGLLQITSFHNHNKDYQYNPKDSILEIEKKGHKAEIKNISKYQSVVYSINFVDENLYQFLFEFGHKNKLLFITLTFENTKYAIENNYVEIVKILNTIHFKE